MRIASKEINLEQAVAVCRWYAMQYRATLKLYDFGGRNADPHSHDTVDLTDAGRLIVIKANLKADDVPAMIQAGVDAPWHFVGPQDDLLTAPDVNELLQRTEALYRHFRDAGLGPTRTHKLLHLKRPAVYPIVDSVVRETYKEWAAPDRYWLTLANEMRDDAEEYRQLRQWLLGEDPGRLTVPRLHDILVWSLHGPGREHVRKFLGVAR